MTRVILRSIRLSLITSNYSCGSVSYVLITSRNEAGDLWSPPRSRCISSVYATTCPTLKIDYRIRASRSSLLLGKVTVDRTRDRRECLDRNRLLSLFFFRDRFSFPDHCSSARSNRIGRIARGSLSFHGWHLAYTRWRICEKWTFAEKRSAIAFGDFDILPPPSSPPSPLFARVYPGATRDE